MNYERASFDKEQAIVYIVGDEPPRGRIKISVECRYTSRTETIMFVGEYKGNSSLGRWLIMNVVRVTQPVHQDADIRLLKYETRDNCQITVEPMEERDAQEERSES
jgi:hypothetical protein